MDESLTGRASEFRCPGCNGELAGGASLFSCEKCGVTFPIVDGILDFRCHRRDYYFNPIPPAKMARIIQRMESVSWSETVHEFLAEVKYNPDWIDNLLVDGRYAWKIFLNLTPDTVLLDLGCGLGNLTRNLAAHVGKTYALDLTLPRLQFAKGRFAHFNDRDDITIVAAGDGTYLPFPDAAVDCVVMSGVLEWVGEGDITKFEEGSKLRRAVRMVLSPLGRTSPRAIQRAFLQEIRRILKPGGEVFVAIENRLNAEYFRGRPDHHSGLLFGSLLPRALANVYSMGVSRRPYRTYTYSVPGYRRLLRSAGFRDVNFFALAPGYTHLKEIWPVEWDGASWDVPRNMKVKERISRAKYFVPAYGIRATTTPGGRDSLCARMLDAIGGQLRDELAGQAISPVRYLITGKAKGILLARAGRRDLAIRLPFNEAALEAERRNAASLSVVSEWSVAERRVPRPLTQGTFQGVHYFVEERARGEPLATLLLREGRTAYVPGVAQLLESLHRPGRGQDKQRLVGAIYEERVEKPLEALSRLIRSEATARDVRAYFDDHVRGMPVVMGLRHGDFGVYNILGEHGKVTGLVDWENCVLEGIAVLDAFNYLDSVHRLFNPKDSVAESSRLLAADAWPVRAEREILRAQCEWYGVGAEERSSLAYLYWLEHVASQADSMALYGGPDAERRVGRIAADLATRATGRKPGGGGDRATGPRRSREPARERPVEPAPSTAGGDDHSQP